MKIYQNDKLEIHDVESTEDPTLTEVFVDDTVEDFPFKDKSEDFICSYKVNVIDGRITMMTPYVDSKALPHIDEQGKKNDDMKMATRILLGEVEE